MNPCSVMVSRQLDLSGNEGAARTSYVPPSCFPSGVPGTPGSSRPSP